MRATNGIPLGHSLLLPVGNVNSVQTRQGCEIQIRDTDPPSSDLSKPRQGRLRAKKSLIGTTRALVLLEDLTFDRQPLLMCGAYIGVLVFGFGRDCVCTPRVWSAVGIHSFAPPLEASKRVANSVPLGSPLFLPVVIVTCIAPSAGLFGRGVGADKLGPFVTI
jgi:hypothetical protein